jgi:hypothetical protein
VVAWLSVLGVFGADPQHAGPVEVPGPCVVHVVVVMVVKVGVWAHGACVRAAAELLVTELGFRLGEVVVDPGHGHWPPGVDGSGHGRARGVHGHEAVLEDHRVGVDDVGDVGQNGDGLDVGVGLFLSMQEASGDGARVLGGVSGGAEQEPVETQGSGGTVTVQEVEHCHSWVCQHQELVDVQERTPAVRYSVALDHVVVGGHLLAMAGEGVHRDLRSGEAGSIVPAVTVVVDVDPRKAPGQVVVDPLSQVRGFVLGDGTDYSVRHYPVSFATINIVW